MSASPAKAATAAAGPIQPFTSFDNIVDGRLLRSLAKQGFTHPTPVQNRIIPLSISESRDIYARAKTGSGKTLSYGIPLVQKIINARKALTLNGQGYKDERWLSTRALIIVPTRELAEQVTSHIQSLCEFLTDQDAIRIVNVAGSGPTAKGKASSDKVQKMHLADRPDVVVATPSRALVHLRAKSMDLTDLECLVIDEADLILSYGHSAEDIKSLLSGDGKNWSLPSIYQTFLLSATLSDEINQLKSVILRDPVTIKLSDAESSDASSGKNELTQYMIKTNQQDKFLLIYVLLKLKLVKGKILIFVNDIDKSYKLKLFLEKFGIRSGVLNAELPFNSRYHAVQEFNRGVFNYLIATDESGLEGLEKDEDEEASDDEGEAPAELISTEPVPLPENGEEGDDNDAEGSASTSKKRKASEMSEPVKASKKKSKKGKKASQTEYGVTRGIDFINVSCVINFDLPTSVKSYIHRIGRTARAGKSGISLSFIVSKQATNNKKATLGAGERDDRAIKRDEKVWKRIEAYQRSNGVTNETMKEYNFDMNQIEGFRYRIEDVLRSLTRSLIREARIKEIKMEVLNSDKLKAHFEDNPRDLAFLKHDKPLHPARVQSHMKHVPSYLMPRIAPVDGPSASTDASTDSAAASAPAGTASAGEGKYIPFNKAGGKSQSRGKGGKGSRGRGGKSGGGRKGDPLKSFRRK